MKARTSKARRGLDARARPSDVFEALQQVSPEQWRELAKFAEYLLRNLRTDPKLARYLAGVRGEEVVNSAVLAIETAVSAGENGRLVKARHLGNPDDFFAHLKQIVRSGVNNFRRHAASKIPHESIGAGIGDGLVCEPPDSADLEKDIAIRDLLDVLLPRVFSDLRRSPKQLGVLRAWAEALRCDELMPAVESKFLRFCVRRALHKQLRQLAAHDLKLENPSGKELLL